MYLRQKRVVWFHRHVYVLFSNKAGDERFDETLDTTGRYLVEKFY